MTSKKGRMEDKEDDSLQLIPLSVELVIRNEDLLTEILIGVPAKYLVRLKCVCKQWLFLISNSQFAYKQFARNRSIASAIVFDKVGVFAAGVSNSLSICGPLNIPPLSFLESIKLGSRTKLVHSSKGLMLCEHVFGRDTVWYSVCNLTTQKYALFPQPTHPMHFCNKVLACLAFDPAKSSYYKVVLVRQLFPDLYIIEIFFSENASWERHRVAAQTGLAIPWASVWDGAVHWMNDKRIHFRFEVDAEKFTETVMPPKPKILDIDHIHYFGECGGQLILIQYWARFTVGFNILEMKRGTSFWTVMCRINRIPIVREFPNESGHFLVLGVVKESHESGLTLILLTPRQIISYNLKFKKVDILADHCLDNFYSRSFFRDLGFQPFIESLFPVGFGPRNIHE